MKQYAECNELRDVDVEGYRLQTWDTGRSVPNGPQHAIAYRFTAPNGVHEAMPFVEWEKCAQCGEQLTRDRFDRRHPELCQACEIRL